MSPTFLTTGSFFKLSAKIVTMQNGFVFAGVVWGDSSSFG